MYRPAPKTKPSEPSKDARKSMTYDLGQEKAGDKRMSMTYTLGPSEGIQHERLDALSLKHPKFTERSDRLDLLTHDLLGITTSIGEKTYALCDISQTGFSYAQEIPANPMMSVTQLMDKVDQFARSNYDKILPFHFFFRHKSESGKISIEGRVRSHRLFFGLTLNEVEVVLNNYLFQKGIKRKFDPQNFYGKMDLLLHAAKRFGRRHDWDTHSIIAMNVTFINFLEEMGAGEKSLQSIMSAYSQRPLFLKFGLSIDDSEQAEEFFLFAKHKNVKAKENLKKQAGRNKEAKLPYVALINKKVSPKKILMACWQEGLRHFSLPSRLPDPKPKDKEDLAKLQSAFKDHQGMMERLFDLDFRPKESNACQDFLVENFYWPLIERDKKWFNRTKVAEEVRLIMDETYQKLLKKAGYKPKA